MVEKDVGKGKTLYELINGLTDDQLEFIRLIYENYSKVKKAAVLDELIAWGKDPQADKRWASLKLIDLFEDIGVYPSELLSQLLDDKDEKVKTLANQLAQKYVFCWLLESVLKESDKANSIEEVINKAKESWEKAKNNPNGQTTFIPPKVKTAVKQYVEQRNLCPGTNQINDKVRQAIREAVMHFKNTSTEIPKDTAFKNREQSKRRNTLTNNQG